MEADRSAHFCFLVEMLDYDVVSPGHGIVGDKGSVAAYRHYLEQLRVEVGAGIAAGMSLEELIQECDDGRLSGLDQL